MIVAYLTHLLILVTIYIVLATSLNLALGQTGLLNMGHIAFLALGAYTAAILAKTGMPFLPALIAAGIIAGLAGYLLAIATRKLKGDYLAIATLGFSFVITSILLNWTGLTNGAMGIAGITRPTLFGAPLNNAGYLFLCAIIAAIAVLIMTRIVSSPYGRLMAATRDNALMARNLGKNTTAIKNTALTISACFAGIAGSLYAHYYTYIDPSLFMIPEIIFIFTIVIIGGIASMKGSMVAAVIIIFIPELLRFISLPGTLLGPVRNILYSLILLLILLYRPRGLFGRIDLA